MSYSWNSFYGHFPPTYSTPWPPPPPSTHQASMRLPPAAHHPPDVAGWSPQNLHLMQNLVSWEGRDVLFIRGFL